MNARIYQGIFISAIFFLTGYTVKGQVMGCTDPMAINFNPAATVNDGSCNYRDTTITVLRSVYIPEILEETSGLVWWSDLLWTHNDDTDTQIYGMDTDGELRDSFALSRPGNRDWEEIAQDDRYFYIGDFGNNGTGKRQDLHILRVSKDSLDRTPVPADTIWFRYALQDSTSASGSNNTDFDCEAFLVRSDTILLFTKEWISQQTTVYLLPAEPGRHVAQPVDRIESNGMITGATEIPGKDMVILCGYTRSLGQPFLMLLYDHPHLKFSRGNQRKVYLDLFFHQVEAVEYTEGWRFFLTNEKSGLPPFIIVPASLHEIDLRGLLERKPTGTGYFQEKKKKGIRVYPNPFDDTLHLRFDRDPTGREILITDLSGRPVFKTWSRTDQLTVDASDWPCGVYQVISAKEGASCIKLGP